MQTYRYYEIEETCKSWGLPLESVEELTDPDERDGEFYLTIVHHVGGYLSFHYGDGEDLQYSYSCLCEVGQMVRPLFAEALKGIPNKVVELEQYPWLIHQKFEAV